MDYTGFINYLGNEKRYSEHTIRSYKSDLDQFSEFAYAENEAFNPLACDHLVIRKWIVFLIEHGTSTRSVHRKASTLKTYYKYLMRTEQVDRNPMDKIILPKTSKNLPHFVSEEKMNILFDRFTFPDTFEGKRDYTILLAFYCTGMRLSELMGIKLSDVDFYNSQVKVLGKRNKERLIPMHAELMKALRIYISIRENFHCTHPYLFITKKGEPVNNSLIYRMVNKYLGTVTTLDKKSPHVLRHTFATQMLNKGADINAIKELLGHANLNATQVYTHTSIEQLNKIHKQAHPRA